MRWIAFASSVSFGLVVASCGPSGGGSSTGSTGRSASGGSVGSSSGSAGNSAGTASSNSGGTARGSSSGGTPSGTGAGSTGGGASGSGGTTGGSSAGAACAEPDFQPCQLNAGYGFCCSNVCTDSLNDPFNCGGCYNQCQGSQTCSQGNCTFPNCDGAPNGALCAGNQGSQDPSQQCVDGICVALSCTNVSVVTECALAGDAGYGSCCNGLCSNFADTTNCGGCGIECPTGAVCVQGACSSSCQDAGCPMGTSCTQSFENGTVCVSASCGGKPDEQLCSAAGGVGGNCCSGSCIDTLSDPQNCGQCYNFCQTGTVCWYGSCETAVTSCANAQVGSLCQQGDGGVANCCGTCRQLDFQTDSNNCGECGVICSQGASCVGGSCVLGDGGYGQCDLSGNVCPPDTACVSSSCVTQSCNASDVMEPCQGPGSAGGTAQCCGSACVDTNVDDANCGLCGTACSTGLFCLSGQCKPVPTCGPGNSGVPCPLASNKTGICCSDTCVDLSSDPNNCEACGVACPIGQVCNSGYYPPCALADGGSAPSCYNGAATCPTGTICSDSECLPAACAPGASGGSCAFGASVKGTCCSGACSDTTQDPANCGTCGTSCASGVCYTSLGTQAQCLPAGDAGSCAGANGGFGCAPGETCLAGNCVMSSGCNGPFGICQAGDGNIGACCQNFFGTTCTDLTTDAQNCGGCSVQCPSGETCAGGLCSGSVSPCGAGRRDAYCDLDAGTSLLCCPGGGCADIETDTANCGYCGYACQPGLACVGGHCFATTCNSGNQNDSCLSGDGGEGGCCGAACLDMSADPNNCGGCGVKCAAVETCELDTCVIAQCSATYQGAPCLVDGGNAFLYVGSCCTTACVDIQSDSSNCGLCGNVCADGGCNGGSCQ